jgi:hypothetical protein
VVVVALAGGLAFVLASLVVSVRLLALASRTRELPELLIGTGLLLMGALGFPLNTAAMAIQGSVELEAWLFAINALFSVVGQGGVVLFTWRVFRRDEAWARALALGFIASMAGVFLWTTLDPGWRGFAETQRGAWAESALWSFVSLVWAGTESLLYHLKLRRRLALGMADPLTTDRLRLWAVSMFAAFTISFVAFVLRHMGVAMTPAVSGIVVGPLGLVAAGATWLAFVPPERYRRWVLGHAPARG